MSNAMKTIDPDLSVDEDESDELFSDDEQKKIRPNVSQDASSVSNRPETPLSLFDSPNMIMPTDAVIPSTPLSLLPFLSKINEPWTSDLETPQVEAHKKATSSPRRTEETPKPQQHTPDVSDVKSVEKIISDSPVIASRATRRRSKRRIFRSSVSIDPTVTDNEDITANVTSAISDANSTTQHGTTNTAFLESAPGDSELKIADENQETVANTVSESLNISTQEFFNNASFSKIDELASNFDSKKEMEIIAMECKNEQNIENIDRGKNIEGNINIGFSTAGGASINVSKQALFKAKRLFADVFDTDETQNYESSVKKSEEENRRLPGSSFGNVSFTIAKETLPKPNLFAEQSKKYDSVYTTHCQTPLAKKNLNEEDNKVPFLSFANGKSINISKEALSRAKTLLADYESDDVDDEMLLQYCENYEKPTANNNFTTVKDLSFSALNHKSIDISKKPEARSLLREQLDTTVEFASKNKISDNEQRNINTPNIGFHTARNMSINSEQVSCKPKALFVERSHSFQRKEIYNRDEIKKQETKIPKIGFGDYSEEKSRTNTSLDNQAIFAEFNKIDNEENKQEIKIPNIMFQTAGGSSINISKQALSKAKALFADQLDCPLEMDIFENTGGDRNEKKRDKSRTVSDQQTTPVSNNAALIEREMFFNASNPDLGRASLQKRKLSETNADESTPLGRNQAFEMKKARLSSEFQARKLFPVIPRGSRNVDMDNNENRDPDMKKQMSSVIDSALRSPERDAVDPIESTGSPVLGKQSISRNVRSLEHQRDDQSALRGDKKINNEKIEDDKLNTQRLTQVTKKKGIESSNYGGTQVMMDFIDESIKILQDRLAAALEQEAIITAKRRHGSKRSIGRLYRCKIDSNARLSLREMSGGAPPVPRSRQELIDRDILEITAATAATYRFRCSDFYGNNVACNNVHGIEMEEGTRLILDENGYAGVWEILRAFLASPGVDPNLVPARWVENHYRWIVWKLASLDRMKFGSAELPRALTPAHVMAQLKYRYDRELDRVQRPAIRRILEKDDVASKRMVLCVSSITENNNVSREVGKSPCTGVPKWRMELTDGWYSVNVCIDIGMVKNISTGKVREGTKLVVSGAELLNCDQGFYPLEAPADVCLKLHTNSTRRARWDAKLGYMPRSGPIPVGLRNVCPSGGLIGKMTIVVARVYPMLYHERTASGDSIVRNAKSEERAQSKYEQQCWSKIETFYAKAEDLQEKGFSCETDDTAIRLSEDYESLSTEDTVSKKRHDELLQELRQKEERFKQTMQLKLRESLPKPRQVSQLLKVRVCDGNANAILSIWSPGEEVVDALKEGACVSLYNVVASGKRGTELQLTARRSAIFKPGKMRDASYPARVYTSLHEIAKPEFSPAYGEFDTVGLVCSVGPAPYGMKDFEAIHLAYCKANSSDFSFLSIFFWQGIATYGYAEILTVGSIVACNNLEWRRATSWNVPAAYCTEKSTFTCNPRRNHLYEAFENLRNLIIDPVKYVEKCTFELNEELQKKSTPTRYIVGRNTPIKMYSSTSSVDKKLVDYTSPKLGTSSGSTFIASNPLIQKRLEKLQYYDEAPELSPIILKNSKRISLDFRSPVQISNVNSTERSGNQSKDLNLSNTSEKGLR